MSFSDVFKGRQRKGTRRKVSPYTCSPSPLPPRRVEIHLIFILHVFSLSLPVLSRLTCLLREFLKYLLVGNIYMLLLLAWLRLTLVVGDDPRPKPSPATTVDRIHKNQIRQHPSGRFHGTGARTLPEASHLGRPFMTNIWTQLCNPYPVMPREPTPKSALKLSRRKWSWSV